MRLGLWLVLSAAVLAAGCGSSAPQPGPDDYVLSVPGMRSEEHTSELQSPC